jgi:hypothetical protein
MLDFSKQAAPTVEFKKMVGATELNWIAINPTVEELKEITGNQNPKEPEYLSKNENGNDKVRLDFWLKNEDLTTKFSIFLENEFKTSQAGKFLFLNRVGNYSWGADVESFKANEKMEWFIREPMRKAFIGEPQIIDFIIAIANLDTKQEKEEDKQVIALSDISKLFRGDYSELKKYLTALKDRKVGVVLGVNEKGYQDVYTSSYHNSFFREGTMPATGVINNMLEAQYGSFKAKASLLKDGKYNIQYREAPKNMSFTASEAELDAVVDAPIGSTTEKLDGLPF